MIRKELKIRIKVLGPVRDFADNNNIRRASLNDYLNGKKDITTKVLFRILEPLNMGIIDLLPKKISEVEAVYVEGGEIKPGDKFKGKKVINCFSSKESKRNILVVEDKNGKFEICFY